MADDVKSNPLIIPKSGPKPRTCPKCGHGDYSGRNIQGVVTFTCKNQECRNQWSGGLPQMPLDPTKPMPPMDPKDRPLIDFIKSKHDSAIDGIREVRRAPNPTQTFRGGSRIPEDE